MSRFVVIVAVWFSIGCLASMVPAAEPPKASIATRWSLPDSAGSVTALAWLPDGTGIVAGESSGRVLVYDLNGRETAALAPPRGGVPVVGLDISRDGQLVAIAHEALGLRLWDRMANTDRTVPANDLFAKTRDEPVPLAYSVAFAADGRTVAVVSARHSIARVALDGTILSSTVLPVQFGQGEQAFIRDEAATALRSGLGIAYYEGHEVDELRVWDHAKGRVAASATLRELTRPAAQAIAPDGARAIVRDLRPGRSANLLLFDVRSLKEIGVLPIANLKPEGLVRTDFSDDGRLLLVSVSGSPTLIVDVARLSTIAQLEGPVIRSIRVAPGNRRLAMGDADRRITIFDLRPTWDANPPKELDATAIAACWNDLASADGAVALRAVDRLADHPDLAVKMLSEKLKPITKPTADEQSQWIAALNAPAFAERQTATKKLTSLADTILPELQREVEKNPSPEVVSALQSILESADRTRRKLEGENLRTFRAVQTLERIGNPAKDLLIHCARGATGALLTEEARAACRRCGFTP